MVRFVAYSDATGTSTMGVVVGDSIAPLSGLDEFYSDVDRHLAAGRAVSAGRVARSDVRLVVPVPSTAKVVCAGLNYRDHAAEAAGDLPDHPDVFGRWASTLTTSGEDVPLPPREAGLDWECELAAVVGRTLCDVDTEEAEAGILGYTCFNDLSARGFQLAGRQMTVGKNADGSGPIGSEIVEPDDVGRARDLRISTHVNGTLKQDASTAQLIFTAAEIISYVSGCMSLRPGDVVATGTPAGVGFSRTPPELLESGDTVVVSIDGIGRVENRVVS